MNYFLNIKYNVIGEQYFFEGYNDTMKVLKNIEPNYILYIWIKARKIQKLNLILKYNSSQIHENPINTIIISEHIYPDIKSSLNKYSYLEISPESNEHKLFKNISYEIDSLDTNYVLLEIKPEKKIEYFELEVNIEGHIYDLNENEKMITNIKANNPIYFFVNATIYNKIFLTLTYNNKYSSPFNYANISEYASKKNISFLKSIMHEIKINKINNNEYNLELAYTPSCSQSKLIAFKFESNINIEHLITRLNLGGGYYEINNNIDNLNLNKIIGGGSIYYFLIPVFIFKKFNMNIIINEDNINKNINFKNSEPFTFANIYEKESKDIISYNKYFNQTL